MEKKKPYSDRRWTDIPQCEVIGHVEFTEEEKAQFKKDLERVKKEFSQKS